MAKITNVELWNAIRAKFPTFASHTAEATKNTFTEAGYDALKQLPENPLNEFWGLLLRVFLQQVNISHAKDTLEEKGFGEYYDNPRGGFIQRMAVNSIKPISPAYKGLKDGDSPNPFVVRKPTVSERFFRQNFDYASLVTIPDDFQAKQIFISEFGFDEFMGGIMEGLRNGYTIQVYENKLEAINAAINSEEYPMQATQQYEVELSDDPTDAELTNLILTLKNIASAMDLAPQTSAFNAMKFASTQDKSRLKMLVRPGLMNAIGVRTLTGAFNPEQLSLPFDAIEVPNFGGLKPFKEAAFTTPLYEVYNDLGEVIGYAETEGATVPTVETDNVFWQDPNADVIAIIADKGVIFNSMQNGYEVEPIRNPRGRYTNYWASSPNNTVAYDPLYNLVTVSRAE